jgi:pullulanase/glycogen debranching enzyme
MRALRPVPLALATLAVALVITGCGSGDDNGSAGSGSTPAGATTGSTSASASPSSSSSGTNVEVTIADGKVTPAPSRKVEVATGDQVHLSVTSDHADEVHVHGYDIDKEVSAGGTVTIDFTADIPGEFEVEAHKLSPSLLFTLVVK